MIRYAFLISALFVVFAGVPACAESRIFLGGDSNGKSSEDSTAPLFLKKSDAQSGNSKSERTPLVFNSTQTSRSKGAPATLYNSEKQSSNRTLYGSKDKSRTAKSGSELDTKLAMLAEQNRKADYDIMKRESEKTKARIARNQEQREARRAAEKDTKKEKLQDGAVKKAPYGLQENSAEANGAGAMPAVKKIFVRPAKDPVPKRTFNPYQ